MTEKALKALLKDFLEDKRLSDLPGLKRQLGNIAKKEEVEQGQLLRTTEDILKEIFREKIEKLTS